MIEARPYQPTDRDDWDALVASSRNGTFLHARGFMEYHADRFQDASAVLRDDAGRCVGVFPANRVGDRILSHGGLTYGGLIRGDDLRLAGCLEAFDVLVAHYRALGASTMTYKPVPHVFHREPADDDLYALFRHGARLVRRDASTVVDLTRSHRFNKGRTWSIKRATKAGVTVEAATDPAAFHRLLTAVLDDRHGVAPVHSVDELRLLMGRFPEGIRVFEARVADRVVAGALVFDFGATVHTQYLANSDEGRETGALDLLLATLVREIFSDRRNLSFGISTENGGTVLNTGLAAHKEGFGGGTVCHDFYELDLA